LHFEGIFVDEETASKVEWSRLQAVGFRHSVNPAKEIEVVREDKSSFVKIAVQDARKEVWIMLNPKNPHYYKQLPTGNYILSKKDYQKILDQGGVSSTVANCLESHVQD
jgi:hypothetical protein